MWKCCPAHLWKLCLQTDVFPSSQAWSWREWKVPGVFYPRYHRLPSHGHALNVTGIHTNTRMYIHIWEFHQHTIWKYFSSGMYNPTVWLAPSKLLSGAALCSICQEHFRDGQLRGLPCWPVFQSKSPLDLAERNSAQPFHGMIMKGL